MRRGTQLRILSGLALFAGCLLAPAAARAGVAGSPHDFSSSGPFTQSDNVAPAGACSACHVPHGSDIYALWARDLSYYRSKLANNGSQSSPNYVHAPSIQCYDCHDYHGGGDMDDVPPYTVFDDAHKPQNTAAGFTRNNAPGVYNINNMSPDAWVGSVSGYYENKPPYSSSYGANPGLDPDNTVQLLKTGGHYFKYKDASASFKKGDKLPCRDCHDPHAWSSTWQAFIKANLGGRFGRPENNDSATASMLMANAFNNSTDGGREDDASRDICIACHGDSNLTDAVSFSAISAAYSSTAGLIVRPPDSIAEHRNASTVACVSCHSHNSVDASCSGCHGFPPSDTASPRYPVNAPSTFVPSPDPGTNDSHPRHVGNKAGGAPNSYSDHSIACGTCHYGSSMGIDAGLGHHQNSKVSVVLDGSRTSAGSGADNTNYYNRDDSGTSPLLTGQLDNSNVVGQGWGSGSRYGGNRCRNVYCHSAGRVPASMIANNDNDYRRPDWNTGRLGCNGCHGDPAADNSSPAYGMPNYPSGAAGSDTANTHYAHVVGAGYECSVCHAGTATGAGANRAIVAGVPTLHVNTARNVQFDNVNPAGTYDNTPATKTCHVSNCHGSDTPRWGGTLTYGCLSCHAGAESMDKPQDNTDVPNPVDRDEYAYSGHGRSGSAYPGSGNAAAGFANSTVAPVDCYLCHSQAALHTTKSANDPFRLGSSTDNTTGGMGTFMGAWADNTDLLCLGCHGSPAERSGHDNAAKGTTTVDAQTHARGITGTKYTWPNTPWKCVDCHDPHGDGKSGAERYMMVRSGINAPNDNTDSSAGSDEYSRPKQPHALRPVAFTSLAGFGDGSYAQSGDGTGGVWGPCEVCHTQTNTYSRAIDNAASHAARTGRCTSCHSHKAGFAPTACAGCHGPDGVAPGAPDVGGFAGGVNYWGTSGHGRATDPVVSCDSCHKLGGDHGTGTWDTLNWLSKPADTTKANTSHLQDFFLAGTNDNAFANAQAMDAACGERVGCHATATGRNVDRMVHTKSGAPMKFGNKSTLSDPKAVTWFPDGPSPVYRTRAPWTIRDVRNDVTNPSGYDGTYGLCVSCHDPHGTGTTDVTQSRGVFNNHMLRGNWLGAPPHAELCNGCHR